MDGLSEMLKGILEGVVLDIIGHGETYGYQIVRDLRSAGLEDVAEGTVYALLVRLERAGLVDTQKKPSQVGPPRKFFTLSARGRAERAEFWVRWDFLSDAIEAMRHTAGDHQ